MVCKPVFQYYTIKNSTYYLQHNTLLKMATVSPLYSSSLLKTVNPLKKPIWLLLCLAVIYSMYCR